jgi:hypothetical protein
MRTTCLRAATATTEEATMPDPVSTTPVIRRVDVLPDGSWLGGRLYWTADEILAKYAGRDFVVKGTTSEGGGYVYTRVSNPDYNVPYVDYGY